MSRNPDEIFDLVKKHSGLTLQTLCVSSSDPTIRGWRWVLAYLLSDLWKDGDDGRVQSRLNCPQAFVEQAKKNANEQSAEGELMRSRLRLVGLHLSEPPVPEKPAAKKKLKPDPAEIKSLLMGAAEEQFQVSRESLVQMSHTTTMASMRRAIALTALSAHMSEQEIADMLCYRNMDSVRDMLHAASAAYASEAQFREMVDELCARLGIRVPDLSTA